MIALLAIALFATAAPDSTPFERFAFRYEGPPAQRFDTIDSSITRWRCGEPPAQGKATLSKDELRRIYDRLMQLRIFEVPTPAPARTGEFAVLHRPTRIYVRAGHTTRHFEWESTPEEPRSDSWIRLLAAKALLDSTLQAQPEYQQLPRSKKRCFDSH